MFEYSNFGHWDLFDIWKLIFGISVSKSICSVIHYMESVVSRTERIVMPDAPHKKIHKGVGHGDQVVI